MKRSHFILGTLSLLSTLFAYAQHSSIPFWKSPALKESFLDMDTETVVSEIPGYKVLEGKKEGGMIFGAVLTPLSEFERAMTAKVKVLTFRTPQDFNYEFSLLVVDGKIRRAFLVSTAIPTKRAITGIHRFNLLTDDSADKSKSQGQKPWPWIKSHKYAMSPMYWGVQISGGYYLHSSPHYGNLGRPASMGCIRASIPDAMEVFDAIANEYSRSAAYSLIYEDTSLAAANAEGTKALRRVLAEDPSWDIERIKSDLEQNRKEILAVSAGDLYFSSNTPLEAHVRAFSNASNQERSAYPICGGVDCWDYFGTNPPKIKTLSGYALTGVEPILQSFNIANMIPLTSPNHIQLATLFSNSDISKVDMKKIGNLILKMKSESGNLQVRFCDSGSQKCWKARGPAESTEGEFVFPMSQVADKLSSPATFYMDVISGKGQISSMTMTVNP